MILSVLLMVVYGVMLQLLTRSFGPGRVIFFFGMIGYHVYEYGVFDGVVAMIAIVSGQFIASFLRGTPFTR